MDGLDAFVRRSISVSAEIVAHIKILIGNGSLRPGTKFPPERELAQAAPAVAARGQAGGGAQARPRNRGAGHIGTCPGRATMSRPNPSGPCGRG